MTPERVRGSELLLKRLGLAFYDFADVRGLTVSMMKSGQHWGSLPGFGMSIWITRACCASLAVTYSRPFVSSHGSGHKLPTLGRKLLRNLPSDKIDLHDRLLNLRHQRFAHGDSADIGVMPELSDGVWLLQKGDPGIPREQFGPNELKRIGELASELQRRVWNQAQPIAKALSASGDLPKSI